MIWVVDGYEIDVLVCAKGGVEVLGWNEYNKIIKVPASMSNMEAIWTIRNLLQTKLPDTLRSVEERLEVFGRYWPIKPSTPKKTAYIKDGIIHCYVRGRRMSSAERIKTKEGLLQQLILRHVGQWEEILDLLIPLVTFRRNRKYPYTVQQANECICFDRELYHQSTETIAYCVFNAIADYGVLDENTRKKLIGKYFPTWKTLEKITQYAYSTDDNH